MTSRKKKYTFLIAAAALMAFAYPLEVTVAPDWSLTVVLEDGTPLTQLPIREVWQHYSVESESQEQDLATDSQGQVHFPRRRIRVSQIQRFFGCAKQFISGGAHASCGPVAYLIPLIGTNLGETRSSLDALEAYRGGQKSARQSRIVLQKCNDGKLGLLCK
jgi:hypothetical protein